MIGLPQEHRQESGSSYSLDPQLVLQVVPPRTASSRDMAALETVMQGLALDARQPVALEIARTKSGRQFLVRDTSRVALEHLAAQIQARYPQASIQPPACDPLFLKPGEIVTAIELRPGPASYLPLRSWRDREFSTEGTDPLLGLLAAMSHVPANMRIVTQLALLPPWLLRAGTLLLHGKNPQLSSSQLTELIVAIVSIGLLVLLLLLV